MAYSTISKPNLHFNTKLFTGNGSTNAITGVGFQPDWIWFKNRTDARAHALVDAVRGTNKVLRSDAADAEATTTAGRDFESFDTDGFTVNNPLAFNSFNESGDNIVAWNWKAGGGQGTSNTDGSINTTYTSVNTTAGFSISSYTGTGSNATVGHGLGAVPKVIFIKELNPASSRSWRVYHHNIGNNKVFYLDLTNAQVSDATAFNSTTPTSSVFSLGTSVGTNESGKNFVAYCFAEKTGYSKFGSYIGNGNANGTFVYTGFKPGWIMWKRKDASNGWYLLDTVREPTNGNGRYLLPAETDAEQNDSAQADLLSNGFKLRNTDGSKNANGGTYVYLAFAEEPLVANVGASIPATAR